jgi:hypothetical protein
MDRPKQPHVIRTWVSDRIRTPQRMGSGQMKGGMKNGGHKANQPGRKAHEH